MVDEVENTRDEVYNDLLHFMHYTSILNDSESMTDNFVLVHRVGNFITIHPDDNTKDDLGDLPIY